MATASDPVAGLAEVIAAYPVTIGPAAGHRCTGGTHSRVADGRIVCWVVPPAAGSLAGSAVPVYAVDAEIADQPVPPALAARWGTADPGLVWPRWTRLEVAAKLTDTPVLILVHAARAFLPEGPPGVEVAVSRVADLVLAHGVRAPSPQPPGQVASPPPGQVASPPP